jgi:hypothetical protein
MEASMSLSHILTYSVDVQDPNNELYQKALEMTEKVFFTNSLHTTVIVVKRFYSF